MLATIEFVFGAALIAWSGYTLSAIYFKKG